MKIAIIEIGGSHDECLYSQIKILKSIQDVHLTLIYNLPLEENIKYFDLVDNKILHPIKNGVRQWNSILKLWKLCKAEEFDKVFLNTAQGKLTSRLLLFPFPKKTTFYGILHDVKKVLSKHSRSQKIISKKIEKYFILDGYLTKKIKKNTPTPQKYVEFHPIFFPQYPHMDIDKENNEIWVCIPGQVELKRRDYSILFDSIEKNGLKKNVKLIFLGRCEHKHGDGEYIKQRIASLSLQKQCMIWDDFVDVTTFYNTIQKSDYILPLIHKDHVSGELYENQISGAFNIAAGYKIPMLVEKEFSEHKMQDYTTIIYNKENIIDAINALDDKSIPDTFSHEKWSFDYQRKKIVDSII